jgi:hypothetical protein
MDLSLAQIPDAITGELGHLDLVDHMTVEISTPFHMHRQSILQEYIPESCQSDMRHDWAVLRNSHLDVLKVMLIEEGIVLGKYILAIEC